ncbi:MAG: hypothetical protein JSU09_06615 [Bacteroidetes bacterium]|nr:hypothetical protein [Bacteroidota bacterium]
MMNLIGYFVFGFQIAMKNFRIHFIIWFLLWALSSSYSQVCAPIPGSTYIPSQFDWLSERFESIYVAPPSGSSVTNYPVTSPFYLPTGNTARFYDNTHKGGLKDFRPMSGWELLQVRFGSSSNPLNTPPSFILYNKNTGLMRVFVLLIRNNINFGNTAVALKIMFEGSDVPSPNNQSSIFEFTQIGQNNELTPRTAKALDQFSTKVQVIALNDYCNVCPYEWVYADLPLAYDACSCQNPAGKAIPAIDVGIVLIDNANLAFRTTGTINGTLVTSGNITATSTNTTIINGGASQTILSGTLGAIDNGAKTFDSFTTIKNALSSATKFKAVPFVGMALGMLDFLLGGGGEQSSGVTITFPT